MMTEVPKGRCDWCRSLAVLGPVKADNGRTYLVCDYCRRGYDIHAGAAPGTEVANEKGKQP